MFWSVSTNILFESKLKTEEPWQKTCFKNWFECPAYKVTFDCLFHFILFHLLCFGPSATVLDKHCKMNSYCNYIILHELNIWKLWEMKSNYYRNLLYNMNWIYENDEKDLLWLLHFSILFFLLESLELYLQRFEPKLVPSNRKYRNIRNLHWNKSQDFEYCFNHLIDERVVLQFLVIVNSTSWFFPFCFLFYVHFSLIFLLLTRFSHCVFFICNL